MKKIIFALLLSTTLFACSGGLEKTYTPRALAANESFDEFPKSKKNVLTLVRVDSNRADNQDHFVVKYKDTTINIQDGKKPLATLFKNARFINSQNTAAVVQVVDSSAMVSPFYLIVVKNGKSDVISLDRPSTGKDDAKFTDGLVELSRTNFVINNDFIVNSVNGKVYPIKRQNDSERIQGRFFMYSRDKTTLVFLTPGALYQVNYRNGETQTLAVPASLLAEPDKAAGEISQNYGWTTSANGTPFLKYNGNPDRIVDIKDFKK